MRNSDDVNSKIKIEDTHFCLFPNEKLRTSSIVILSYGTAIFMLGGIDENKTYFFEAADGGEFSVSGSELKKNGFKLIIPEKRKAKIYFYKSKN